MKNQNGDKKRQNEKSCPEINQLNPEKIGRRENFHRKHTKKERNEFEEDLSQE